MVPEDDGASPAPIDRAVLEWLQSHFAGSRLFESAAIVAEEHVHLRVKCAEECYPDNTAARLSIRWCRNDDFSVHYREERSDRIWQCRWDRHPNGHNARDHFHPPPAARQRDTENAQWPDDHRSLINSVLDRIEGRIETLWAAQ